MQLGGIGSNHGSDMHQVTNCLHEHNVSQKKGGAAMASQSSAANQQQITEQSPEAFSLTDWMKNVLGGAKSLWGKIWGSNQTGDSAVENSSTTKLDSTGVQDLVTPMSVAAEDSVMSQGASSQDSVAWQTDMRQTSRVSMASTAVPPPVQLTENPYFSAIEKAEQPQPTLWQKARLKFRNIAGYLTRNFSFSNKNAFQTKQEKPKEDLSRRSRYRRDELEIDCVLTDESYLMDSYNKKGEYSTLTTDKK